MEFTVGIRGIVRSKIALITFGKKCIVIFLFLPANIMWTLKMKYSVKMKIFSIFIYTFLVK